MPANSMVSLACACAVTVAREAKGVSFDNVVLVSAALAVARSASGTRAIQAREIIGGWTRKTLACAGGYVKSALTRDLHLSRGHHESAAVDVGMLFGAEVSEAKLPQRAEDVLLFH